MKRKVEVPVKIRVRPDGLIDHISWGLRPPAIPEGLTDATLTYEVDEPEQTVTMTMSEARGLLGTSYNATMTNNVLKVLGFK